MVELGWFFASLVCTAVLTWRVLIFALSRGRLDVPNTRSSHTQPTARGGGLAIAAVLIVSAFVLAAVRGFSLDRLIACGIGGLMIATVGYLDDVKGLPVAPRFVVHACAAVLLVLVMMHDFERAAPGGAGWSAFAFILMIGTIWSINLFNFMDGIDGIAASQATFMAGSAAILGRAVAGPTEWSTLAILTAGTTTGFLVWNYPPAKIFMGDVGSGFLGFWVAALAIGMHVSDILPLWTSITLAAVFLSDATVTLLRRVLRGDRWYEAHRSHAYQILARRWNSHLKVTALVWFINLAFLLPLAYVSVIRQAWAMPISISSLAILAAACAGIGAGRPPRASDACPDKARP